MTNPMTPIDKAIAAATIHDFSFGVPCDAITRIEVTHDEVVVIGLQDGKIKPLCFVTNIHPAQSVDAELLSCLKEILISPNAWPDGTLEKARAAIARAEGRG